jgi:hypothetical protein
MVPTNQISEAPPSTEPVISSVSPQTPEPPGPGTEQGGLLEGFMKLLLDLIKRILEALSGDNLVISNQ